MILFRILEAENGKLPFMEGTERVQPRGRCLLNIDILKLPDRTYQICVTDACPVVRISNFWLQQR